MLIVLVIYFCSFEFLQYTEASLLEPRRRCVVTSVVKGPCHLCVCTAEGIFHCHHRTCQEETIHVNKANDIECEPDSIFRQNNTFCTCTSEGLWQSENCQLEFRHLHQKTALMHLKLHTNIICIPNTLYIIDCNICQCTLNGSIDVTSCTNRHCFEGHKADRCQSGDILRLDQEMCACSEIDYYVDRLCIRIQNKPVQSIHTDELSNLIDIGRSWRQMTEFKSNVCDLKITYTVDCNQCVCVAENELVCSEKVCSKKLMALREMKQNLMSNRDLLPEVHSKEVYCTPGLMYRYKCNTCSCSDDANVTQSIIEDNIPQIKDGETCIYGRTYKVECNVCRCGYNNTLVCTKMGCLGTREKRSLGEIHKNVSFRRYVNKLKKTTGEGAKRSKILKNPHNLKPLPDGDCIPGNFYINGCQKCFCTDKKVGICSHKKTACGPVKYVSIKVPDDVRPPVQDEEFVSLPKLGHSAEQCEPGRTYRLDCNPCICMANLNLLCDKLLCLSREDTHRIEARRMTGKQCNGTAPTVSDCVQCSCQDGTFKCTAIVDCVTEKDRKTLSYSQSQEGGRVANNYKVDQCEPNAVYRDNCNKCYCQEDKSLRCTLKTCLNYVQALKFENQLKYLEEHGL